MKNFKSKFMEIYFRIVFLLFWPIYWYKWTVITIENYNVVLFRIYFIIDIIFIFILIFKFLLKKINSKRYFLFSLTTAVTYLISLFSFMIYPINVYFLYLKIFMSIILIIVSWNLLKKDNNEIGVVGIIAGFLILVLTYFY